MNKTKELTSFESLAEVKADMEVAEELSALKDQYVQMQQAISNYNQI